MRWTEIINEREFKDVGLRGDKFYLSASDHNLNDTFFRTGKLEGVQGISSSKYIWQEFSPNAGRSIFFVMDAHEVVRLNEIERIGYDDPDALIADNSRMIGRILSIKDVARSPGDNLISGVFSRAARGIADHYMDTVNNRAQFIASDLRKGRVPDFKNEVLDIDLSGFGDFQNDGLRLSSYEDYRNLYYQASIAAGWYGEDFKKFWAPQNRSKNHAAIKAALLAQAKVYAGESEWVVKGTFTVPQSSLVILSIPEKYQKPKPEPRPLTWSRFDDEYHERYQILMDKFKKTSFKVKIVDADRAAQGLFKSQVKRRSR